jgi:hypothetical protein
MVQLCSKVTTLPSVDKSDNDSYQIQAAPRESVTAFTKDHGAQQTPRPIVSAVFLLGLLKVNGDSS